MAEETSLRTGPGDLRGWPPRRRRLSDLGRWPFTVGVCALLAVGAGTGTVLQHEALQQPGWLVFLLVAVAVLPWLVDLLVVAVPAWVFAPAVIVPVAVLHDPAARSAVPLLLLLAVLALDMGLWLGLARSAPVVAVCSVVVLWPPAASGVVPSSRVLGAVIAAWLVGLALHSQVRRVDRLRAAHAATGARLDDVLAQVRAAREALEGDRPEEARARLAAAESGDRDLSGASGRGDGAPDGTPAPPPSGPSR